MNCGSTARDRVGRPGSAGNGRTKKSPPEAGTSASSTRSRPDGARRAREGRVGPPAGRGEADQVAQGGAAGRAVEHGPDAHAVDGGSRCVGAGRPGTGTGPR